MLVLSVKQPWAYLLCAGIKDIENRTWDIPKKIKQLIEKNDGERILIHASAKPYNVKLEVEGQATAHEIPLLSALNKCDED